MAAVFYLAGEEFDRDPFLIFKLRGLDREELFELLGGKAPPAGRGEPDQVVVAVSELLSLEPAVFWEGRELPENLFGEVRLPPVPAALPKRLGSLPFWRGQTPFLEALESRYVAAGAAGLEALLGLTAAPTEEEPISTRKKAQPQKEKKTSGTKAAPKERSVARKVPKKKKVVKGKK